MSRCWISVCHTNVQRAPWCKRQMKWGNDNFSLESHDRAWLRSHVTPTRSFFLCSSSSPPSELNSLCFFLTASSPSCCQELCCETWVMDGRVNGSPCFQMKIRLKMLGSEGAILMVSSSNVGGFVFCACVILICAPVRCGPVPETSLPHQGLGDTYHDYVTIKGGPMHLILNQFLPLRGLMHQIHFWVSSVDMSNGCGGTCTASLKTDPFFASQTYITVLSLLLL